MTQRVIPPRQYATEGLRPQTLLFTFLGHHVLAAGRRAPIATSTMIEVLARLGVSAQAAGYERPDPSALANAEEIYALLGAQ